MKTSRSLKRVKKAARARNDMDKLYVALRGLRNAGSDKCDNS